MKEGVSMRNFNNLAPEAKPNAMNDVLDPRNYKRTNKKVFKDVALYLREMNDYLVIQLQQASERSLIQQEQIASLISKEESEWKLNE